MSFPRSLAYVSALVLISSSLVAQAHKSRPGSAHNMTSGTSWAMQAMAALTGGNPVGSASESGSVTRTLGGDRQAGSITLQSSGIMANQINISTDRGTLSEARTWQNGYPAGNWTGFDGIQHPMADHNCWTDAVWFFPALSLLADYADPNLVFTDLGQVQYQGGTAEHIQVYRTVTGWGPDDLQVLARLSMVDYYLDSQTALPVAMAFATHPDSDFTVDIPVMTVFASYHPVNGIQVPFQIVRAVNGTVMLQIVITSASPSH